ncbi:MAG TPA: hypothetical protein VFV33_01410 [Gemmatimonadaceae bacterium]|nr:hypothetical protein [Gemmatimonadaceae bacterium]
MSDALSRLTVALADRFLSEIRTTARLQHPHILPLLDSGEADGLLYYVMPLVTGETLRARHHPPRHQAGEHPAAGRARAGGRLRHRPRRAAGGRRAHDIDG